MRFLAVAIYRNLSLLKPSRWYSEYSAVSSSPWRICILNYLPIQQYTYYTENPYVIIGIIFSSSYKSIGIFGHRSWLNCFTCLCLRNLLSMFQILWQSIDLTMFWLKVLQPRNRFLFSTICGLIYKFVHCPDVHHALISWYLS